MTTAAVGTRAQTRRATEAAPAGLLWARTDLVLIVAANVVGAVLILIGWLGSSDALTLSDSVDWLKVGIVGVIFAGICNGLFLLRGRRAVGLARRAVLGIPRTRPIGTDTAAPALVALAGSTRVHVPTCPMVLGKPVQPATDDLQPCELCRPEVGAR
jgi:hypothetical protein